MNYSDLTGDTGKGLDFTEAVRAGEKLLRLVRNLRERLGADYGLLDQYLVGVLTAMTDTTNAHLTAAKGFEYGTSPLRGILRNIKEGNEDEARYHPFYPQVKAYIDAHPLLEDAFHYDLYFLGLFAEYVPFAIQEYMDECNNELNEHLQEENVLQLREALQSSNAVTADELHLLHSLISRVFTWVAPSSIFAQGMVDQMMLTLIGQDEESDGHLFQRILDSEI